MALTVQSAANSLPAASAAGKDLRSTEEIAALRLSQQREIRDPLDAENLALLGMLLVKLGNSPDPSVVAVSAIIARGHAAANPIPSRTSPKRKRRRCKQASIGTTLNAVVIYFLVQFFRVQHHNGLLARFCPEEAVSLSDDLKLLILELPPLELGDVARRYFEVLWLVIEAEYGELPALPNLHLLRGLPHDLHSTLSSSLWNTDFKTLKEARLKKTRAKLLTPLDRLNIQRELAYEYHKALKDNLRKALIRVAKTNGATAFCSMVMP